ncbi:hypothetical protein Q767_00205 [Flavobacterium enshiense DK69]|uniref:Uncharacterized protein n=2 Tax=Flavobacterium TaxID=237 RepID=A0A0A2N034_9FLAO|nr:hypothetical protein Q767_00205 [Flavobacterium enshiense DK69]
MLMNKFLIKNQRLIILISSLLTLAYSIFSIYGRVRVTILSPAEDRVWEMVTIIADLPMLIPAFLGLFYFAKRNNTKLLIPIVYTLLLFAMLFTFILQFTQDNALGFALPMFFIVMPICIYATIALIGQIFKSKSA